VAPPEKDPVMVEKIAITAAVNETNISFMINISVTIHVNSTFIFTLGKWEKQQIDKVIEKRFN